MNTGNKIYVAGHTGLVGSAITRNLQENGYCNLVMRTRKELDLRRQEATEKFFEQERPACVFLAAAKIGGILANNTYKAEFIYDNITITTNIIHAAYKYGVKKLLNFGSSCIYPKFAPQPIKNEYLLTGSLEPTNEPHAIAKIAALKLCRYYNEQYGTNFISVMPTSLYGPHDNFNLETAHVLPSLIRKFHLAKLLKEKKFKEIKADLQTYSIGFALDEETTLESEESLRNTLDGIGVTGDYVVLWGNGEPYREFLHVDDLADACVFLIKNYDYKEIGEFVNIGTGKDIKIKDLASMIREIVGFDREIRYDLSKPDGTPRKVLDISTSKLLGWEPKTSLEEGIKITYEWYIKSSYSAKTIQHRPLSSANFSSQDSNINDALHVPTHSG